LPSVDRDNEEDFPANAEEYELLEEIGEGATARVSVENLQTWILSST
jgi:hypothetical protein